MVEGLQQNLDLFPTKEGLQQNLDLMHRFCQTWTLTVNLSKIKIMVVARTINIHS